MELLDDAAHVSMRGQWSLFGGVVEKGEDPASALLRKLREELDLTPALVVCAFLHAIASRERMRGQIYNVGLSAANVWKRELCEIIARHVPGFLFLEAPVGKDPDQRNYIVSNAKIEATGFKPAFSLDAGVAELVKGFAMIRNNRYGNV